MTQITVKRDVKLDVAYVQAECGVRYWEDATVNGVEDDNDDPKIPFVQGSTWQPLIELETGKIVGWPEGTTASVHYKVCDDGRYWLLDADKKPVKKIDGYVPSFMAPEGDGYGDYVIMKIGPDGKISNWKADLREFEESGGE